MLLRSIEVTFLSANPRPQVVALRTARLRQRAEEFLGLLPAAVTSELGGRRDSQVFHCGHGILGGR